MTGTVPEIARSIRPLKGLEGYSALHPHPLYKKKSHAYGPAKAGRVATKQGHCLLPALEPHSLILTPVTLKAL